MDYVEDHFDSTKRAAEATKDAILRKVFHKGDSNKELLWGLLHIKIIRCQKLRNLDKFGVKTLLTTGKLDKSDPYVTVFIDDYRLLKTTCFDNDLNPVFDEEFYCPVAHVTDGVTFKVKDMDTLRDESLGNYTLPVGELIKLVHEKDIEIDPELAPHYLKRVGVHKIVYLDGKKHYVS